MGLAGGRGATNAGEHGRGYRLVSLVQPPRRARHPLLLRCLPALHPRHAPARAHVVHLPQLARSARRARSHPRLGRQHPPRASAAILRRPRTLTLLRLIILIAPAQPHPAATARRPALALHDHARAPPPQHRRQRLPPPARRAPAILLQRTLRLRIRGPNIPLHARHRILPRARHAAPAHARPRTPNPAPRVLAAAERHRRHIPRLGRRRPARRQPAPAARALLLPRLARPRLRAVRPRRRALRTTQAAAAPLRPPDERGPFLSCARSPRLPRRRMTITMAAPKIPFLLSSPYSSPACTTPRRTSICYYPIHRTHTHVRTPCLSYPRPCTHPSLFPYAHCTTIAHPSAVVVPTCSKKLYFFWVCLEARHRAPIAAAYSGF